MAGARTRLASTLGRRTGVVRGNHMRQSTIVVRQGYLLAFAAKLRLVPVYLTA